VAPGNRSGQTDGADPGSGPRAQPGHRGCKPQEAFAMKSLAFLLALLAQGPDDAQREAQARALLADFAAGRFEAVGKTFDARMREALPLAKVQAFAAQLAMQAGAFKKVRTATFANAQGYRVVTLVSD